MSKFYSVNEIDKFDYKDCYITNILFGDSIQIEVEALIVKAGNSMNTNYTDSYAATTMIELTNAKISAGCIDGYKYYNANDELIRSVEDKPLNADECGKVLKDAVGDYLYNMEKTGDGVILNIETIDEENSNTVGDSYTIDIKCTDVNIGWDKYLNRVEK